MALVSEELYSLIIPLEGQRLVVPRSCVAEIVRYNLAEESADDDSWLRGVTNWDGRAIPVVSFERICGFESPVPGGRTRIVVFHPLSNDGAGGPYGILSEGFPHMVRVNKEVIETDSDYKSPVDAPIICQVRMLQERALIPDLELLEQRLREARAPA
jgi:chemosensory pili system protein ChpC